MRLNPLSVSHSLLSHIPAFTVVLVLVRFESLLFLFNEHPYDVGDMVGIGEQVYEVKKVRLLYTVMLDMYGHTIYFSSKELLEKVRTPRAAAHSSHRHRHRKEKGGDNGGVGAHYRTAPVTINLGVVSLLCPSRRLMHGYEHHFLRIS
jgi:hypothetical protein